MKKKIKGWVIPYKAKGIAVILWHKKPTDEAVKGTITYTIPKRKKR